ncbi:MAG: thiamine phosphate synthase [Deltaproteobacteria bacterium]|nr:thiamine phosphate synthase [Deltaproteobacteria bacterium]MBW2395292.1 thiamine phosphate synthase [Deltaproteobacteria bacterium]
MSFALAGLFVLADDDPRWSHDPVAQARAACAGGAAVVQLRTKHATDRVALAWAREIRELTREAGVGFFVNDRFDLALLAEADGVHLGQEDLAPEQLPAEARARLQVGRSTHDEAQLIRAMTEPVDYVAFGPVFGTRSKESPYTPRGLEALSKAAARVAPKPLVAIGGIGEAEAGAVEAAGAAGFAVISAVAGAADPLEATRRLVEAFGVTRLEESR